MTYELMGYQNLDFKTDDGKQIKGMQLFMVEPIDLRNGEGRKPVMQKVGRQNKFPFINADILQKSGFKPKLGAQVEISTGLDGKINFVRIV